MGDLGIGTIPHVGESACNEGVLGASLCVGCEPGILGLCISGGDCKFGAVLEPEDGATMLTRKATMLSQPNRE